MSMATCSTCKVSISATRLQYRVVKPNVILQTKALSTSSSKRNNFKDLKPWVVDQPQEPLTILHKTSKILPDAFPSWTTRSHSYPLNREIWERTLSNAFEDLSAKDPRPVRVVVYGVDESAGAYDLVTALLANPLSSDAALSNLLRERWRGQHQDRLNISYGTKPSTDSTSIQFPSSYLQQFSVPLHITELRCNTSTPSLSSLNETTLASLFEADIPIVVCNPLTTSLQPLLSTPLPSKTIIVLNSSTSQEIDLASLLYNIPSNAPKPILIIAEPARASSAVQDLQSDPNSSTVIQKFQDDFTGSNVSAITLVLRELLQLSDTSMKLSGSGTSPSSSGLVRTRFALLRVQDTLIACKTSMQGIRRLLDSVSDDISHLDGRIEELNARVENEIFGPQKSTSLSHEKHQVNQVTKALKSAEKEMQEVMAHLNWWKMSWRVDEISNIITSAMQSNWCPELEKKLLMHTGRLTVLQKELSDVALFLLSKHPVLPTAVLRNTLLQLKTSPQYQLTSKTLTNPISTRREQIIAYPTTRLHVAGQRAVLGMTGGILGGTAMSWAGWMGWLAGSGEGLFGFVGMEPTTSIGVGMLGAAVSVRWAVGKWERAKKKWWQDWTRVGEGLDRDLRVTLQQAMRQKVTGVAKRSCNDLKVLLQNREQEIGRVDDEVHQLQVDSGYINGP